MTYIYECIISAVLAFIISFTATPIAKKIAFRIGAVDIPRDNRRMHQKPIARLGGLAIVAGFLVSILYNVVGSLFDINSIFVLDRKLLGLLVGALIVVATGIADDIVQLNYKVKLAFHIVAAVLVVVISGTRITFITNPFSHGDYIFFSDYVSYPLTILWIVGITSAINFSDGLDGLAAGVSTIASLSLFLVSLLRPDPDIPTAIITATLAGCTLGFLPYNFNPAKIFMADSGATFLGFILGVISIQGTMKSYTAIAVTIPLLVLGLPIFDTLFAIIRRAVNHRPIWEADRGHLHHRLIDMGLTQKQSVAILYSISAALGLCAIVLVDKGALSAVILVIAVSVFIMAGARYMTELGNDRFDESQVQNKVFRNADAYIKTGTAKLKVMTVFGTRPDAVKMAPLIKELHKYEQILPIVCVTAQHRQMLDQVLQIFRIKPDFDLNIMQNKQTLEYITTKALEGLSGVIGQVKPDIVLVHGDTSTCFVGSLAAFYKRISVGHVEAGLRTFDKYYPYPEEMNRRLAGVLSDLHFAPTEVNRSNLLNEGIREDRIHVTGNTVIDALKYTVKTDFTFRNRELQKIDFSSKRVITVDTHRRENLGEPLRSICRAMKYIVEKYDDIELVYSVHLNPAVQEVTGEILGKQSRIHLVDPLDVEEWHNLMAKSYLVMTDSGGLQEEAPSLGKPVLVLRNETERPEAVRAGTIKLAGTDEEKIIYLASQLMDDAGEYKKMAEAVNPYGDGNASLRIAGALLYEYGISSEKPEEFILQS